MELDDPWSWQVCAESLCLLPFFAVYQLVLAASIVSTFSHVHW